MASFFENILSKFLGNKHEKDVKNIQPQVDEINKVYESLKSLSNDELRNKTQEFKKQISDYLSETDNEIAALRKSIDDNDDMGLDEREEIYESIDKLREKRDKQIEEVLKNILPAAFAVVKETAYRFTHNEKIVATATALDKDLAVHGDHLEIQGNSAVYFNEWTAAGSKVKWDMVHYDVQLIGGVVLHSGKIAEMKTGEGKTLVSTLPVYLNALAGQGVHMVTVNDYLSRRDSEWMRPLFNFLGLTVDCIDKHPSHSEQRRAAYHADVTYGTNNEFGFDYLRDNMVRSPEEMVQRKFHYAIVDEVDSVLIDDARTPLIISGPVESTDEKDFYELKPRIQKLFDIQQKLVTKCLSDAKQLIALGKAGEKEGEGGLALLRAQRALPKNTALIKYLSEPGSKQILQKVEGYYLQNNQEKMPEADKELYFTIDEKNNSIDLTEKGIELITASGEEKDFFILPDVGFEIAQIDKKDISADAKLREKDELMQNFAIKSERLHSVQQLLKAYALFEKDVDYIVDDGKVKIVDENTGRVLDGRRYSDGLHQAIEAKESVKVQAATQTWATVTLQNYFRMYHKLAGMTGTAETEAGEFWEIYKLDVVVIPTNRPVIRDDSEDLVYKTRKEKFTAMIDEIELLSKAGRPVLVGTTNVEVSELISRILTQKKIAHNVLNAKQHQREAEIVAMAGKPGQITIATNMAGRGTDIKINDQVKKAGGLAIIGSERHDSRRIDRQLRGRAGRQGDPGSSIFYVSLEDELMRLFGSERIAKVMDRMGYDEGEVIQHSMITKSIERAQKKVEENNFGIRKRLLEYDDVMNNQRNAIYNRRRHALFGERLKVDIYNTFYDLIHELIVEYRQFNDFDGFTLAMIRHFSLSPSVLEEEFTNSKVEILAHKIYNEAEAAYRRKCQKIAETTYPILNNMFIERGETVKNVVIPFNDGNKELNVVCPLEDAVNTHGKSVINSFEKNVTLALIDDAWKSHLRVMDDLKQEVQMASYEQKDPLVIYKTEAFGVFKSMLSEVNRDIVSFLFRAKLPGQEKQNLQEAHQAKQNYNKLKEGRDDNNSLVTGGNNHQNEQTEQPKTEPVRVAPKVGRNDLCPCGSGKKYKKCHGRFEE